MESLTRTSRALLLLVCTLLCVPGPLHAQFGAGIDAGGDAVPAPSAAPSIGEPLLEKAIEAVGYQIGPGDVLALALQGTLSKTVELIVSPEGTVLIPGASSIRVAGLSLEGARAAIRGEVAKAFRNVDVSVTLVRLRRFTIFVLGQVMAPGQFTASPVDRVSEGIRMAGGIIDRLPLPGSKYPPEEKERGSERAIWLLHQDGTRSRCDLLRFRRTGDLAANPTVRDGDVILVDFRRPGVLVHGEVHSPGEIEFVEEDSLGGLVALAGGLTENASLDTIEVARWEEGALEPKLTYLHGPSAARLRMEPKDAVLIRARRDWDVRHTVRLDGEVVFPGTYVIVEEETRLSDLITRAGGFTADASLREAKVLRRVDESLKDAEFERLRLVTPADMSPTEYEYFKMRSRQRIGLMAVDFTALFEHRDDTQDVTLRDEDLISVPPRKTYVTLAGRVALPGNLAFEQGLSVEEYIERAGGYAWRAARSRTVVIRASSGEWIPKGKAKQLGPGDTIWVPDQPDRDWYGLFKDTLLVVSQLATVYLVIKSSTQ